MPGVLLIEGMAQAGGLLLLHDLPQTARTSSSLRRHRGGEVPPAGGARRPDPLRGGGPAPRSTFCKVKGKALVDGELAARPSLLGDGGPQGHERADPSPRPVDPGRDAGRRRPRRTFAVIGPDVEIGDGTEVFAGARSRPGEDRPREPHLSPACIGFEPQDLKFGGERVRLSRSATATTSARCAPSTAARPRAAASPASAATTSSWPTPTRPRLPGGEPHDLRQQRDARRARRGARRRQHQRLHLRAPVLPT